jgi:hypothetical protein
MTSDEASGEWRRRTFAWYEMPDAHCELCGRPLGRRVWIAAAVAGELTFCEPACELLWRGRHAEPAPRGLIP